MKYHVLLGQNCQIATTETGIIFQRIIKKNDILVEKIDEGDVVIFHPCKMCPLDNETIKKLKGKKLIVIGCYYKEDFKSLNNVLFIPSKKIHKNNCSSAIKRDKKILVHIGYGCNHKCFYCPIKKKEKFSRPPKDIIRDIGSAQEVELLMDDCASYEYKNYKLKDLLKIIKSKKIIIDYVYPSYLEKNKEFFIKNKNRIVINTLPLQSGSKKILKLMNRNDYTPEKIIKISNLLKCNSLHLIFGHPEETWEDFKKTVNIAKKTKAENIAWFCYEIKKGTFDEKKYKNRRGCKRFSEKR